MTKRERLIAKVEEDFKPGTAQVVPLFYELDANRFAGRYEIPADTGEPVYGRIAIEGWAVPPNGLSALREPGGPLEHEVWGLKSDILKVLREATDERIEGLREEGGWQTTANPVALS